MSFHIRLFATLIALFPVAHACAGTYLISDGSVALRLAPPSADEPPLLAIMDDAPPQEMQHAAGPFAEGARYWSLTAGTSRDPDLGRIHLTQFSLDFYVQDSLALRFGATLGYADADRTDGGVQGGPEVGFRWHFLEQDRFSVYLDGSLAAVVHENPLTEESLRFNFDLQAGVGATLLLADDTHLLGGVRWHHLSNARIRGKARNLGYDGPMVYIGVMRAF